MSASQLIDQMIAGDAVYGADGNKIGTIAAIQPTYLVVGKGFFPTDYYIPKSAVAGVQRGKVTLNVSKDGALQSGWNTVPDERDAGRR